MATQDLEKEYLALNGYTGALQDMNRQLFASGGPSGGGLYPSANTVIFGDSITNQNNQTSATFSAFLAKGYITQANIMLEQRFEILNNAGVSGNTTSQMLARIDADVLAYKPKYCIFMGGTNDVGGDVPYETTVANYKAIFTRLKTAGITVVVCTMTPRTFTTQARLANMLALNRFLQDYVTNNSGFLLIDLYRPMLDYSTITTVSQGTPVASWFDGAGLHPLSQGAVKMGASAQRQLGAHISRLPRRSQANWNGTNGDSANKITNGMFMSGSGGVLGLGASGTVPQGWTAAASGGLIAGALSNVTRESVFNDGFPGNVLRVDLTMATAVSEFFRLTPTISTPSVGDLVYMEFEVSASASSGIIHEISCSWGTVGGTVIACAGNYMPSTTESLGIDTTIYKGVIRTPAMVIPTGTVGAYGNIGFRTSTGAVAQVHVANARLTKIN
jgi:lysophospholipase L1-like esterase